MTIQASNINAFLASQKAKTGPLETHNIFKNTFTTFFPSLSYLSEAFAPFPSFPTICVAILNNNYYSQ